MGAGDDRRKLVRIHEKIPDLLRRRANPGITGAGETFASASARVARFPETFRGFPFGLQKMHEFCRGERQFEVDPSVFAPKCVTDCIGNADRRRHAVAFANALCP